MMTFYKDVREKMVEQGIIEKDKKAGSKEAETVKLSTEFENYFQIKQRMIQFIENYEDQLQLYFFDKTTTKINLNKIESEFVDIFL